MTQPLIPVWSKSQVDAFGKSSMTFAHGLGETSLFDDEALIELLDRYPAELYDINLFDIDDVGQLTLRTGTRGRAPGREVLANIKEGRIWVQLRRIEAHYPAMAEAMRAAFGGIAAQKPGFRAVQLNGQLIISAPGAKVAFHADAPNVALFHVRGKKRIWIYPSEETYMPQKSMELIALKQTTEDLAYTPEWDAVAEVFDLEPGQAVTWPLHSPHRVENLEGFNISLSVDFQTWGSRITNGAFYANGLLRRWGLPVAAMTKTPMAARTALWAASLGLRRLPLVEDRIAGLERSFELGDGPVHDAKVMTSN